MPVTEREPAPLERLLDGFDDLVLYRYPHVVGPPFVALLALGLAEAAYLGGHTAATLLAVVAGAVFLLAIDSILRLPGRREQNYAWACWIGGCGWTALAAYLGPFGDTLPWIHLTAYSHPIPPLLALWGVLLAAGWPPWTKHRRVRRAVDVAKVILAWDGDAVGLPEVRLSAAGAKADADGWEAPLIPDTPGKWTTDKLRKAIPNIASHYGRAVHELSIDKVRGDREGKWVLRFREAQKREPVIYQPPTERPSAKTPFTIGHVTADPTTPLQAEVWREGHGGVDSLITGMKGFGKTVCLQRVALHAISTKDGLLFLGDMKPGSPDYHRIGPRGAYLYATTAEQIDAMILVLLALCRIRGKCKRRNRKVIFVALDEMALYFAPTPPAGPTAADRARAYQLDMQRQARFTDLAAISRAYDIALWEIAQKGKEKNTGGDARSLISAGQVIGFYALKMSDGALVSADAAFDPTKLPRGVPGQCLVSNGLHSEVVRGTLWNVTEATIRDVLDRFAANGEKGLDDDELKALREEFGEQWDDLRMANRENAAQVVEDDEPEVEEIESEPQPVAAHTVLMTADESRDFIWRTLATFPDGASLGEIAEAAGKSPTLVRIRLRELIEGGRAKSQGVNRWTRYHALQPQGTS